MPNIQVKLRRGTATEHDTTNGGFTGAEGEVTVDTTNDTLRVHDGSTAGGVRLAKHSELSGAGGGGTVTSVDSGTGLTGGPITTSGTLSIANDGVGPDQLANTAVSAGSYTNTNLTVDAQGRIIAASTGSGGAAGTPNWNSGWFNDSAVVGNLTNGGTYTFTHGLGTTNLTFDLYVSSASSGTNPQSLINDHSGGTSNMYGAVVTNITSTQITVQLGNLGYLDVSSSGTITTTNFSGVYIKVVASASATVGAVSKYASSWFNNSPTNLANGGTYTFTHGLGTDEAQVQVWMATSSAGANIKLASLDTDAADLRGASITALSTTSVTVQLTNAGWTHLNSDGSRTTGSWGTTYTHIKVVVIG